MDSATLLDLVVAGEIVLDDTLNTFNVRHRGVDRWHAAFKVVRTFRDRRKQAIAKGLAIVPGYEGEKAKELYQAMYDCWDVTSGLYRLDESNDPILVRDRLRRLLSGPVERTGSGSAPGRDILFELTIFSELKGADMDVHLMDPNPDIQALVGGRVYHIECKRISGYSYRAFTDNLHAASKQVMSHLPDGHKGVLAVSLTDYITHGTLLVKGETEADIDDAIQKIEEGFLKSHQAACRDPNVVHPGVAGMLFYTSYLAILDGETVPYNYVKPLLVASSATSFLKMHHDFITDFSKMHNPVNGERDFKEGSDLYVFR